MYYRASDCPTGPSPIGKPASRDYPLRDGRDLFLLCPLKALNAGAFPFPVERRRETAALLLRHHLAGAFAPGRRRTHLYTLPRLFIAADPTSRSRRPVDERPDCRSSPSPRIDDGNRHGQAPRTGEHLFEPVASQIGRRRKFRKLDQAKPLQTTLQIRLRFVDREPAAHRHRHIFIVHAETPVKRPPSSNFHQRRPKQGSVDKVSATWNPRRHAVRSQRRALMTRDYARHPFCFDTIDGRFERPEFERRLHARQCSSLARQPILPERRDRGSRTRRTTRPAVRRRSWGKLLRSTTLTSAQDFHSRSTIEN